jgi:hypothetical protein
MIDYALIIGMLYFSDLMGIYFPLKKKRQRIMNKDQKDLETKLELKDIIGNTLCNYLDSDKFVNKINTLYFKDINDINRARRYNNNVNKIKDKIRKLHDDKLQIRSLIKKKILVSVNIKNLDEIKKDVLEAFKLNESVRLDRDLTLEDIYNLFRSFDFLTHQEREGLLDISFDNFVKKFLPYEYEKITQANKIKIDDVEIERIIEFVIRMEHEMEILDKIDLRISNIILLTSMWSFCLYFREIIKTFSNVSSETKICLIEISEMEFDIFFNKYKSKNVDCKIGFIRDKLCSSHMNGFVEHVFNNSDFSDRLIEFFELGHDKTLTNNQDLLII